MFGFADGSLYRMNLLTGVVWRYDVCPYAAFPTDRYDTPRAVFARPRAFNTPHDVHLHTLGSYLNTYTATSGSVNLLGGTHNYLRAIAPSTRTVYKRMQDVWGAEYLDCTDQDDDRDGGAWPPAYVVPHPAGSAAATARCIDS